MKFLTLSARRRPIPLDEAPSDGAPKWTARFDVEVKSPTSPAAGGLRRLPQRQDLHAIRGPEKIGLYGS